MNSSATQPNQSTPPSDADRNRWRRRLNWFATLSFLFVFGLVSLAGYRFYRQMTFISRIIENYGKVRTDHSGSESMRSMLGDYWIMGFEKLEFVRVDDEMPDSDLAFIARKQVPEIEMGGRRPLTGALGELLGRNRGLETLTVVRSEDVTEPGFAEGLSRASALKSLTFYSCVIEGDALLPLAKLNSLQEVSLGGYCDLQTANLSFLKQLPNLKRLTIDLHNLDRDRWEQIAAIDENRVELTVAKLDSSDEELLVQFAPIIQIDKLTLATTSGYEDARKTMSKNGVAALPSIRGLKSLEVGGEQIHDETLPFLAECRDLKSLIIASHLVTDEGLPCLYGLQDLDYLKLYYTRVTIDGLRELRSHLPGVQVRVYPPLRN